MAATRVIIYYIPGEHKPAGWYVLDHDYEAPGIIAQIQKVPGYAYVIGTRVAYDQMGANALLQLLDPNS